MNPFVLYSIGIVLYFLDIGTVLYHTKAPSPYNGIGEPGKLKYIPELSHASDSVSVSNCTNYTMKSRMAIYSLGIIRSVYILVRDIDVTVPFHLSDI